MTTYYNRYSDYLKGLYGSRVQKISVSAGMTCPNRDGSKAYGGCSYCNNESFTPSLSISSLSIKDQILTGIERIKHRYPNADKFFVYFQSYSNTYAPLEKLKELYESALSAHPQIIGLCIGTRPDCVDEEKLDYIQTLSSRFDITIEYGIESLSDETLKRINRGHDVACAHETLKKTAERGIKSCVHMILGFPWEDRTFWIEEAKILSKMPINFLKLHQLHIVEGTLLAEEYKKHPFSLLSPDDYMDVLCDFLDNLNPKIIIQRLFGQAPRELLVSPDWNLSMSELNLLFEQKIKLKHAYQGRLYE